MIGLHYCDSRVALLQVRSTTVCMYGEMVDEVLLKIIMIET